MKIGVIGCGKISKQYFEASRLFKGLEMAACADLNVDLAKKVAQEYGVPKAYTANELLADPDIQIVLNLTIPAVHAEVNLAAIRAGKHVYCEKPLAIDRADGQKTLAAAKKKKVRVGCAPDTFLGGGIQTCIQLVNEGLIGRPVAATAFMASRGIEGWHPNPVFYYKPGAGPMFDMGPYYLTALVNLVGPIRSVSASTGKAFKERLITSEPLKGQKIKVEVATHYAGTLEFENGAIGTIITSFDICGHHLPRIEIHGTEGSLSVPDPNRFDGQVQFLKGGTKEWVNMPLTHTTEVGRFIGLADMAAAISERRPHRASGEMAYHVLEVMAAFDEASKKRRHITIRSRCKKPAPMKPSSYQEELGWQPPQ